MEVIYNSSRKIAHFAKRIWTINNPQSRPRPKVAFSLNDDGCWVERRYAHHDDRVMEEGDVSCFKTLVAIATGVFWVEEGQKPQHADVQMTNLRFKSLLTELGAELVHTDEGFLLYQMIDRSNHVIAVYPTGKAEGRVIVHIDDRIISRRQMIRTLREERNASPQRSELARLAEELRGEVDITISTFGQSKKQAQYDKEIQRGVSTSRKDEPKIDPKRPAQSLLRIEEFANRREIKPGETQSDILREFTEYCEKCGLKAVESRSFTALMRRDITYFDMESGLTKTLVVVTVTNTGRVNLAFFLEHHVKVGEILVSSGAKLNEVMEECYDAYHEWDKATSAILTIISVSAINGPFRCLDSLGEAVRNGLMPEIVITADRPLIYREVKRHLGLKAVYTKEGIMINVLDTDKYYSVEGNYIDVTRQRIFEFGTKEMANNDLLDDFLLGGRHPFNGIRPRDIGSGRRRIEDHVLDLFGRGKIGMLMMDLVSAGGIELGTEVFAEDVSTIIVESILKIQNTRYVPINLTRRRKTSRVCYMTERGARLANLPYKMTFEGSIGASIGIANLKTGVQKEIQNIGHDERALRVSSIFNTIIDHPRKRCEVSTERGTETIEMRCSEDCEECLYGELIAYVLAAHSGKLIGPLACGAQGISAGINNDQNVYADIHMSPIVRCILLRGEIGTNETVSRSKDYTNAEEEGITVDCEKALAIGGRDDNVLSHDKVSLNFKTMLQHS